MRKLLAILLVTFALHAQDAAKIDAYIKATSFNGTVLFAKDGKIVLKKGYGMANFEWDIANAPSTKFRLGSITKQFTAMSIMQLEERGLLKVDDPIGKYLTDYPKPVADQVTIHHLLTHSSGIPSYTDDPDFFAKRSILPLTPKEMIDTFKEKPLDFKPGAEFKYDNSGYFLLGVIIEKVSGKKYEDYLKENIFEPLGMHDSGYDRPGPIIKNRAAGYQMSPKGMMNASYLDMGLPYAAGSLYSTVDDLYIWDQALYTEKLVKRATMERIFKPWIAAEGMGHYGYGWGVTTANGHKSIAHGGGINGFNTMISRYPDDHAVFIWLRNVTSPLPPKFNEGLADLLLAH